MEPLRIENYKLKDGSIYSGEYEYKSSFVGLFIMLSGNGEIQYPNGDSYIGQFENGKVHGTGKYIFKDGDIHYGEFYDGIPYGIGYLNKHNSMNMGNFKDGKLNGWAISINNGFHFGWWENGHLKLNLSESVNWAFGKIRNSSYNKSWAQVYKNGKLGFGIPQRKSENIISPSFEFLFEKNGSVSIGCHINYNKTGHIALYRSNGDVNYYLYENDCIVKEINREEFLSEQLFGYHVN